ncbi:MAG: MBL fold metallo-hydrolase [Chloroflexota bacterium]
MMEQASIIWWGCAGIEVAVGDDTLLFDPYLRPTEPRAQHIVISHEHYDHCHGPTLRRLTAPGAFQFLLASKACFHAPELATPAGDAPHRLEFIPADQKSACFPHYRSGSTVPDGPTQVRLGRWLIEGVESGEAPKHYKDGRPTGAAFVQVGYLATDTITGFSIYHPGDLHDTFPMMEQLRGKVQIMCYPLGKTRAIETAVVDLIRPRWLVPIHYRLDEPAFPIPFDVDASALTAANPKTGARLPGASDDAYAREMAILMRGHWYPTPEDPLALITDIQQRLGTLATFVTLTAGKRYPVDTGTGRIETLAC